MIPFLIRLLIQIGVDEAIYYPPRTYNMLRPKIDDQRQYRIVSKVIKMISNIKYGSREWCSFTRISENICLAIDNLRQIEGTEISRYLNGLLKANTSNSPRCREQ